MSRSGLLYHAGGLGDFVLSLPAVFRVVQGFDGLSWSYWGPSDRLSLLPGFGPAPAVLVRSGHTLWGRAPDPGALELLGGCGAVLAFGGREPPSWARGERGRLLPVASFPPSGGPPVPVFQGRQLDALGVPRVRAPWLPGWRRALLGHPEPAAVVLHPGSGDRKKNLPPETWREVAEGVSRRTGLAVQVLLGPAEQERGGWAGEGGVRCDTLPELVAALREAALFLGNDSGPAHLAALLGVPTAAVFGPSDPGLWRPWGPRVRVVAAGAPCAPCTAGGPVACTEPRCLAELAAARLVAEAAALLGGGRADAR